MREQNKSEVWYAAGIALLAAVSLLAFVAVAGGAQARSMGPGRHQPSACAPGVWTCISPIEKPGHPRPRMVTR